MFTLLLSTDKKEISELYSGYADWKTQGFEMPVITSTAEDASRILAERRFDAVSSLLPLEEGRKLFNILKSYDIIGMQTARDEAQLHREVASTRRILISRQNTERQTEDEEDMTMILVRDFLCGLLRGCSFVTSEIENRIAALRGAVDPELPIVTASFRLPEVERFTEKRWKYGKERLNNALRNVFEQERNDMRFVMSHLSDQHLRILGHCEKPCSTQEAFYKMMDHMTTARKTVEQIFDTPMILRWVNVYEDLYALSAENASKMAH